MHTGSETAGGMFRREADGAEFRRGLSINRGDIIFGLTCLSLLAGVIVPLPMIGLDILWILTLCLGLGLLIVCVSLRYVREAEALPGLVVVWSLMRIAAAAATARAIFRTHSGGNLISLIGDNVPGSVPPVLPAGLAVCLSLLGLIVVIQLVKSIGGDCRSFQEETLPLRNIGIEADLNAGVISTEEARGKEKHLMQEANFYGNIPGAMKILVCDVVFSVVVLAALAGHLLVLKVFKTLSADYEAAVQGSAAAGAALLFMPAPVLISGAVKLLTLRALREGHDVTEESGGGRKIRLINRNTHHQEVVEILNPDFKRTGRKEKQEQGHAADGREGMEQVIVEVGANVTEAVFEQFAEPKVHAAGRILAAGPELKTFTDPRPITGIFVI